MSQTAEGAAPAAASNPEWLKLGTNKFPTHATELQDLIRAAVAREIPESNISAFSFHCELAGPDLPQVAIDMSGWQVPIPGMGEYVSPFDKSEVPQTVHLVPRSEEHTSELQSRGHLVCRLLLENKKKGAHH